MSYNLKVSEGRFAGLYDASFDVFLRRIQRRVVKIADRHKCGRIVDLGCGTGSQCVLLHNKKFDVTGIDLSSKMLEIARKKNAEISFLQRDITSTGFPDSHFDCAIISFVLHMNSEKNERKILNEAKRIIRHDGMIVITDYGIPSTFKGKIAELPLKIIENLALEDHKKNYRKYMERGALEYIIGENKLSVIERHKFYFGVIETITVQK
ncbi:MAG: hypothetical protein DRN17_01645 [Thermoplasmata archaeon]|nr:MAG: hypothetical protein DRN17_01645 [Thermoplasmata archaeon]